MVKYDRHSKGIQGNLENKQQTQLTQSQIEELNQFCYQQQVAIQRFLVNFQALWQKFSQHLQLQKQNGVTYPFLLPIYNNYFHLHLGPTATMPDVQKAEKLGEIQKNAQRLLLGQHYQHQYQAQLHKTQQEEFIKLSKHNSIKTSLITHKSIENEVKLEENAEQDNNEQHSPVLLRQKSQINNFQDSLQSKGFKFTTTPYLSQIDLKEEANKIRQRYRNRQEGKVKKRIRKTKEEIQIDLREGKDPKETKNIPKNYAKAIMTYLLKNDQLIDKYNPDPKFKEGFLKFLQTMKLAIQNIKQFKAMLSDQELCPIQQEYNKIFRIISRYFLKNHAVAYIFNSRITQKSWHIKYRTDLLQAVKNPITFRKVKPKKRQNI